MSFWGNVNIDNSPAPVGTIIRAYYSTSTLAGEIIVKESGVYGYINSLEQKLLLSDGSGIITFKFQTSNKNNGLETVGLNIQSYDSFSSGITINKDLNFKTETLTVAQPVSSGGGGGGGGGGSISTIVSTTTSTSTSLINKVKGDGNNDNRTDVFDFNLLMIDFGKSGSNLNTDFNSDGIVDVFDFNLLMINWSK